MNKTEEEMMKELAQELYFTDLDQDEMEDKLLAFLLASNARTRLSVLEEVEGKMPEEGVQCKHPLFSHDEDGVGKDCLIKNKSAKVWNACLSQITQTINELKQK